jgi:response regulator RpfG family c-di-GMP phosphodiesterase
MEKKTTTPGSSQIHSGQQAQETILVVDDDIRVIELLQITLTGRGYTVNTAFDGEAALEELERHQPDLLVLDVRLPRKSGFQILESIRADQAMANLPVILISGNPSNEARIQGLRMGADDYLIKPFSPRELIMKIRRILDRVMDHHLLRDRNESLECEVRQHREDMLQAHTEMQRNLMKIGTVLQRVEQINQRQSLHEVFDGFVHAIVTDVGINTVCLLLKNPDDGSFKPEVWRGVKETAILNLSIPADGFLGEVVTLEGRTMNLDEFGDYPRAVEDFNKLAAAGFTNLTPIRLDGEVVAMIAAGDRADLQPLSRLEIHLLSVLARSAATSIQNAGAFDEVRKSFVDTTAQLVSVVEARYENIEGHSQRVHDLSLKISEKLGLSQNLRRSTAYTALLHDLGALSEYDRVFEDQTLLTDEERDDMRKRSSQSVTTMLQQSQMPDVADAIAHICEYWDGSGIPDGLVKDSIPLPARIVAVANAFDALIHHRPHRAAYSQDDALRIIEDRAGRQFDPTVVNMLIDVFREATAATAVAGGLEQMQIPADSGDDDAAAS